MAEAAKSTDLNTDATGAPLQWVRLPRQERSAKTLERILDATEDLAAGQDLDSVSVADICRAARCSVGVFYSRFSDKGELLRCLFERKFAEAVATAENVLAPGRWQNTSVAELVDLLLVFAIENRAGPGNLGAAFLLASRTDRVLAARIAELRAHMEEIVYKLVHARAHEVTHPDLRVAIHYGVTLILDTIQSRALFPPPEGAESEYTDAIRIAQLRRVLVSYFGVSA